MRYEDGVHPVIALVCSAGGLDALQRVLAPLPADLPAAIVVLQHTSPEHPSQLAAVLANSTALTVAPAQDADELVPGRVLVAPSGHHTLIRPQQSIVLIPSGDRPPYRPSADLLLATLATAVQGRAIAVVLSGQGSDAAAGASAVHRLGGTVIVSSTDTSSYPAMPRATMTRDHITDHVLPLDEVGPFLTAITCAPLIRADPDQIPG